VVHKAIDRVTGEEVAVKFEWIKAKPTQLLHEARLYKELTGTRDVPRIYWSGTEGEYNIMVLELLGPNLYDLFKRQGRKFSMESALKFWEQMIDRLMFLHSRGIIHRDLKPDNFLVGTNPDDENLYIIDFGLSKRYVNAATGNHIPMRKRDDFVGTPRFISDTVQNGWEPCRRDDLISVGYVTVMLLNGKLPWQSLKGQQSCRCKKSTTNKDLCKGLPNNFVKYFDYVFGLAYDDTPDYDYLKQLIRNSCVPDDIQKDAVADLAREERHERKKSKNKKDTAKKLSPAKKADANALSYKAVWDEVSAATVKKIMYIKENLPGMLAYLMQ